MRNLYRLRRNGYSGPFFMGVILALCGLQLLVPWETFGTSASYDVMADWASEGAWGVFLMGVSVFILGASLKRDPEMVAVGALVAAFGWLIVTVSVGLASSQGLLFPIVLMLMLRSMSLFREFTARKDDPHLTGPAYPSGESRRGRSAT